MVIERKKTCDKQQRMLSGEELSLALGLAAALVDRYSDTLFERASIRLFERLEEEIQIQLKRASTRERARTVLQALRSADTPN